jgi:hypothetical protein
MGNEGDLIDRLEPKMLSENELIYIGVGILMQNLVKTHPRNSKKVAEYLVKNFAIVILKPREYVLVHLETSRCSLPPSRSSLWTS